MGILCYYVCLSYAGVLPLRGAMPVELPPQGPVQGPLRCTLLPPPVRHALRGDARLRPPLPFSVWRALPRTLQLP